MIFLFWLLPVSVMVNAVEAGGSNGHNGGGDGGGGGRAPRLPRWTRQEILVLIQGKRVVESRGRGRGAGRGGGGSGEMGAAASPVEPKWASVSSYCRRHGVDRGPVQCRKRWSNLAGDFKKIKEWEAKGKESFWTMRNDLRRERRLPGFFDREVYDILDGVAVAEVEAEPAAEEEEEGKKGLGRTAAAGGEEEEAVFDSGRTAAEDGLFSDFEEEKEAEDEDEDTAPPPQPVAAVPISGNGSLDGLVLFCLTLLFNRQRFKLFFSLRCSSCRKEVRIISTLEV